MFDGIDENWCGLAGAEGRAQYAGVVGMAAADWYIVLAEFLHAERVEAGREEDFLGCNGLWFRAMFVVQLQGNVKVLSILLWTMLLLAWEVLVLTLVLCELDTETK